MPLLIGDVIRVFDRQTHPPKQKRLICIDPDRQLFLRINTSQLFRPHLLIRADGADFLDHDSYVELQQLIRPFADDINHSELLGKLTETHAKLICISVRTCTALSDDLKENIIQQLETLLS